MLPLFLLLGLASAPASPAADSLSGDSPPAGAIWVESIGLEQMTQRRGRPRAARSIRDLPITLGGVIYRHGIGTRSISEFMIDLKGAALRFESTVGLDDVVQRGAGTVTFEVWADDRLVAQSGLMHAGDPPQRLLLDDGSDTSDDDEGAWGGAVLFLGPGATERPQPYLAPAEPAPAVAPAVDSVIPAIHGPKVIGGTPGRPFLFRVPATGGVSLRYSASGLPPGLLIDEHTGIISGSLRAPGTSHVTLTVRGARGVATRPLAILSGPDALARTPPMGWNSWNVWGPAVDQQKVLAAADWLEKSGLAAHGYNYVVIDDTWEGARDAQGEIQPNQKFPDLRALAQNLHARGLKLGIYSSPGPHTCENYAGSWQHEAQDAATYARWGVDFLKYDWCSYDEVAKDRSLPELKKPYVLMREALAHAGRDIVYSLCQYGYGAVWNWGAEVGGNMWRTSGDLLDNWSNLQSVGFRQAGRESGTRPGHWNDPDMLVVGTVGWGPDLHATRLTPNEQMLHLALWALQAAPLFVGADLARIDPFTLALLTNDEVLEVDQDPLGHAASRVWKNERTEVWSRPLADGTIAVGLFNRGLAPATVTARWSDLGLAGRQPIRDLWQRKDLDTRNDSYAALVPRHGVVLVKIGRPVTAASPRAVPASAPAGTSIPQ
jgi:alpha-galactosidase